MTTTEAVEKFLTGYFGAGNRSLKTQRAYSNDLAQFRDFVGKETQLGSICPETLEAWAAHLQSSSYLAASIRRKFASVRVFFSYWVRREAISSSPLWRLRLSLGKQQQLPRSLSPADSRHLIEQAWRRRGSKPLARGTLSKSEFLQVRDIAIVETLFATGMRVGELVKLKISDWHPEDAYFLVRGKGGRERLGFLPDHRSLGAMTMYVGLREKGCAPTDPLFVNAMGKGISEQGVAIVLARIAKSANIARRVTPHMIRHTVATLLLRYGADLRIVQEVLGHASISTTQRYVHVAKDHLLETLRIRHPNYHLNVTLSNEEIGCASPKP